MEHNDRNTDTTHVLLIKGLLVLVRLPLSETDSVLFLVRAMTLIFLQTTQTTLHVMHNVIDLLF